MNTRVYTKSPYRNHSFVVKRALLYLWEFKIASKTKSNLPIRLTVSSSKNDSTDYRATSNKNTVFVVTTYTLTQSVTEVLNYLDEGKL